MKECPCNTGIRASGARPKRYTIRYPAVISPSPRALPTPSAGGRAVRAVAPYGPRALFHVRWGAVRHANKQSRASACKPAELRPLQLRCALYSSLSIINNRNLKNLTSATVYILSRFASASRGASLSLGLDLDLASTEKTGRACE
jgi:hypothetical protein